MKVSLKLFLIITLISASLQKLNKDTRGVFKKNKFFKATSVAPKNATNSTFRSYSSSSSFSSNTVNGVTKESGIQKRQYKSKLGKQAMKVRKYGEKYKKFQNKKVRNANLWKKAQSNQPQEQAFLPKKPDKTNLNRNQEKVN